MGAGAPAGTSGAASGAGASAAAGSGVASAAGGGVSSALAGSSGAAAGAGARAGSSALADSATVFFLRFSFGRDLGAAADPQVAPPPTGVFVGTLYAGPSAFCFSSMASAAARSGKRFSSSVSIFCCEDIFEPHPPDRLPRRLEEGTHLPPLAAAAPNREEAMSSSFFSFSSLTRWASRSMASLAAASCAFVSSTRSFSAISDCSFPPVLVLRDRAFVSTTRSFVVAPAGTTTAAPLRSVLAARASSSQASSFPAAGSFSSGRAPVVGTRSPVERAGASTWTVFVTWDASIVFALNLNVFFFFFFLAKKAAASDMVVSCLCVVYQARLALAVTQSWVVLSINTFVNLERNEDESSPRSRQLLRIIIYLRSLPLPMLDWLCDNNRWATVQ
mmetsp:Transcript_1926/g.5119  ORF Transcript_1926/g.5119 Transcript_1926/m.5119 type:complete len:389 (-) Transcript_1926:401-1567(-)